MAEPVGHSEHLELFFEDRGGDILLVTFNEMGMTANGSRYWGDDLARKLGLSVAGFVSRRPNWFPQHDMPHMASLLDSLAGDRFRQRIGYGHSQGGYAAIKYGGILGLTHAISFCPQWSIDPDDIADGRFARHFVPALHAGMRIRSGDAGGKVLVIHDPKDAGDAAHVHRIMEAVPAAILPVPYTGHETVRAFAGSEFAGRLLSAVLRDHSADLNRLRIEARRRYPRRAFQVALACAPTHPRLAERIFRAYFTRDTGSPWSAVLFRIGRAGHYDTAIRHALGLCEDRAGDPENHACAALICLDLGLGERALDHVGRALGIAPDSAKYGHIRDRAVQIRRAS